MTAGAPTVGKPVAKASAAIPLTAPGVTPAIVLTGVADAAAIHDKLDSIVTAVGAKLTTDESKAKIFFKKYWPIIAGVAIALSRLIHL